jgi:hypothetical protein
MQNDQKKKYLLEWWCRIVLTIHFLRIATPVVVYLQSKKQLTSPFIPSAIIDLITEPYWKASMLIAASFLVSLWLYFLRRKIAVIVICGFSILVYESVVTLLAQYTSSS